MCIYPMTPRNKPIRKPRTRKPSKEWLIHTVRYHQQSAEGFRRSAERARSGRSTPEAAQRLEQHAAKAEHAVEYWGSVLRRCYL